VVSAVIVVERTEEGHALPVQRPVYYISKVLSETKARYPQVQKLLYAVVLARRKLRHYFESVVSSFPLGEIIHNPDAAGRIAKWLVELMGETLVYASHKAIKSQILADPGRVLDSVLRRVSNEDRCGRGPAFRQTPRGAPEIRHASPLPRIKQ
jgi:hypothetical protein